MVIENRVERQLSCHTRWRQQHNHTNDVTVTRTFISVYVTSHADQLSLAIPSCVGTIIIIIIIISIVVDTRRVIHSVHNHKCRVVVVEQRW